MKNRYVLFFVALSLAAHLSAAHSFELHVDQDAEDPDYLPSVWVEKDGERVFEHKFTEHIAVNQAGVSPSGQYVSIRTAEKLLYPGDYNIYSLSSGEKTGSFYTGKAGRGGMWTYGDKIMFFSSGGTYLSSVSVRDITGAELHRSTHCTIYPSRDGYYITYSPFGSPTGKFTDVEMYNINTDTWTVLAKDVCKMDDEIHIDMEKRVVRIEYHDKENVVIDLPPSPFRRYDGLIPDSAVYPEYTVQEGDTLWSIAERHYGDGSKWRRIQKANEEKICDDGHIKAGMVIAVP